DGGRVVRGQKHTAEPFGRHRIGQEVAARVAAGQDRAVDRFAGRGIVGIGRGERACRIGHRSPLGWSRAGSRPRGPRHPSRPVFVLRFTPSGHLPAPWASGFRPAVPLTALGTLRACTAFPILPPWRAPEGWPTLRAFTRLSSEKGRPRGAPIVEAASVL